MAQISLISSWFYWFLSPRNKSERLDNGFMGWSVSQSASLGHKVIGCCCHVRRRFKRWTLWLPSYVHQRFMWIWLMISSSAVQGQEEEELLFVVHLLVIDQYIRVGSREWPRKERRWIGKQCTTTWLLREMVYRHSLRVRALTDGDGHPFNRGGSVKVVNFTIIGHYSVFCGGSWPAKGENNCRDSSYFHLDSFTL